MRYLKVLIWTVICVVLLTVAQFGCVRLLNARPASWLFEMSLDLAPPLLFAGDMAELHFNDGSQAALRDQLQAVGVGMLVNIAIYSATAVLVTWLFFPPRAAPPALTAERQKR